METFVEWANPKIKLGFSEKYSMFLTRLSTLQSMKISVDAQDKPQSAGCCGGMVSYLGLSYGDKKSPEETLEEADLMWNELKEEIKSSLKTKKKE